MISPMFVKSPQPSKVFQATYRNEHTPKIKINNDSSTRLFPYVGSILTANRARKQRMSNGVTARNAQLTEQTIHTIRNKKSALPQEQTRHGCTGNGGAVESTAEVGAGGCVSVGVAFVVVEDELSVLAPAPSFGISNDAESLASGRSGLLVFCRALRLGSRTFA
jgi:hypothetical protein